MIKKVKQSLRPAAGVSLVELVVVLVIIGVLAAIAIPLYTNHTQNASEQKLRADLSAATSWLSVHLVDSDLPEGNTPIELPGQYGALGMPYLTFPAVLQAKGPKDFCIAATSEYDKTVYWDSVLGGFSDEPLAGCPSAPQYSTTP